jgi:hypothetical protein
VAVITRNVLVFQDKLLEADMKFANCKIPREGSAGAIGSHWNFGLGDGRDVACPSPLNCLNHVSRTQFDMH